MKSLNPHCRDSRSSGRVFTCKRCGKEKPLECFHERRVNDRWYPVSYCRPCMAEYQRARRERLRAGTEE